jgi:hypothetical protein
MQTFLDSKQIVQQKMLERQFEDTMRNQGQSKEQHGENKETNQTHRTPFVSVR